MRDCPQRFRQITGQRPDIGAAAAIDPEIQVQGFIRWVGEMIIAVIQPDGESFDGKTMPEAYIGPGLMINSDQFNGVAITEQKGRTNPGIGKVIDWLEMKANKSTSINTSIIDKLKDQG